MVTKEKSVKQYTSGNTENCIYFRIQYGQKNKWLSRHDGN